MVIAAGGIPWETLAFVCGYLAGYVAISIVALGGFRISEEGLLYIFKHISHSPGGCNSGSLSQLILGTCRSRHLSSSPSPAEFRISLFFPLPCALPHGK